MFLGTAMPVTGSGDWQFLPGARGAAWRASHGYAPLSSDQVTIPQDPNASAPTGMQPNFWSQLPSLINTGMSLYNQKKIMDENRSRMRQGLPPLTEAQIRAYAPPVQGQVQVGMDPQTQKLLIIGGAVLAVLLLVSILKK